MTLTKVFQYSDVRPDNCIALGHFPGAQSQACCDNSRQALWNCCNRKRYSNLEVIDATAQREFDARPFWQAAVWLRLPREEVVVVDEPHQNADHKDDLHGTSKFRMPTLMGTL